MAEHLVLGKRGEDIAVRFLTGKGWRIVERNVRFRRGELDLVARDGKEWVFVEVKTRSESFFGSAVDAFTPRKAAFMRRAVREYARLHRLEEEPIRCDLVTVDLCADGKFRVNHFPCAVDW